MKVVNVIYERRLTSRTGDWQAGFDGRNRIIEALLQ